MIPIKKSGSQLKMMFKAFSQNRLSFHLIIKDPLMDPVARLLFMRYPKVTKDEAPQQAICVLNVVLSDLLNSEKIQANLNGMYPKNTTISKTTNSTIVFVTYLI